MVPAVQGAGRARRFARKPGLKFRNRLQAVRAVNRNGVF